MMIINLNLIEALKVQKEMNKLDSIIQNKLLEMLLKLMIN